MDTVYIVIAFIGLLAAFAGGWISGLNYERSEWLDAADEDPDFGYDLVWVGGKAYRVKSANRPEDQADQPVDDGDKSPSSAGQPDLGAMAGDPVSRGASLAAMEIDNLRLLAANGFSLRFSNGGYHVSKCYDGSVEEARDLSPTNMQSRPYVVGVMKGLDARARWLAEAQAKPGQKPSRFPDGPTPFVHGSDYFKVEAQA